MMWTREDAQNGYEIYRNIKKSNLIQYQSVHETTLTRLCPFIVEEEQSHEL